MWTTLEVISASLMTLWVIMLLLWLLGFVVEYELCWTDRARKYVWQQWKIYTIVFGIIGVLQVLSFILMVKLGIPK